MAGRSVEGFRPIGVRLATLRTNAGLTQRVLAERVGKPPSYIAKVEKAERRLDLLDLQLLATALEWDVGDLAKDLLSVARAEQERAPDGHSRTASADC